jgi:hypothetical protein
MSEVPENSVVAILGRIEKHIEKLDKAITGGDDPRGGLAFKVAKIEDQIDPTIPDRVQLLEVERQARESRDQKRDAWIAGIGITVASALVLVVLPKLFQLLSSAPQ